jgi:hypothetical protein
MFFLWRLVKDAVFWMYFDGNFLELRRELPVYDGSVRVHREYPEAGVAGLVVGNRLEVNVHFAFGGFHPEAWRR